MKEENDLNKKEKKVKLTSIKKRDDKKINSLKNTVYKMPEEKNTFELAEPEAAVQYKRPSNNNTIVHNLRVLRNSGNKPENQMTSFEKIGMIRDGISKKDLENLKEKAGFDYNQLSKVLSVARATLINKKGNDKFDISLSEKIVSVADIYSYGYEVFEDENKFNNWIFRANRALGGQSPFDLLDSQFGREEIKSLIGRIDYGVYS